MAIDNNRLSQRVNLPGVFLALLLSADAAFVLLHLVHTLSPFLSDPLFSIERDWGYGEAFQYVKTYWIAIMLAVLGWRTREAIYGAWTLLYIYLLCDDAFRIHEQVGRAVARHLGYAPTFGLKARDLGELTVQGAIGLAFLVLIASMYVRSARDARRASIDLAVLSGAIAFFAVPVDMLHNLVAGSRFGAEIGLVEDGGEMVAMSAVGWYALQLVERRGHVPEPLWRRIKTVLTVAYRGRARRRFWM